MNRKEYKVNTRKEGKRGRERGREKQREWSTFENKYLRSLTKDVYTVCGEKHKKLLQEIKHLNKGKTDTMVIELEDSIL